MSDTPQHDPRFDPAETTTPAPPVRPFTGTEHSFRWADVPLKEYKADGGTHFKDITRQTLFGEPEQLPTQLRYFEIAPGGYSTLERHQHVHAVMILRGRGRALVGEHIYPLGTFDLVHVPPMTWHQFRAADDEPLGFLCLVDCQRDRPQRPTPEEAEALRARPGTGDFIRI